MNFSFICADLHQLLRPELLQRGLTDKRHQRDILQEASREIEIKMEAFEWERGRGAGLHRRDCSLDPRLSTLCISLLRWPGRLSTLYRRSSPHRDEDDDDDGQNFARGGKKKKLDN